ncbi:MAG: signal transduction protein, partial [Gammaproteobacteria bacterium]
MLKGLVGMLSGNKENAQPTPARATPAKPAAPAPEAAQPEKKPSVMRREAMLGRDQRVAGYTFMLRRALDDQRESSLPEMRRLYDETLLGNLQRMEISRLLGQRMAFVPLAPASLTLAAVEGWPAAGTTWLLDLEADPAAADVVARVTELKARGFAFAVEADAALRPQNQILLPLADYVLIDVTSEDMAAITAQIAAISKVAAGRRLIAVGVQTLEAFHMCHKLQFALFMGPFITRRENLGNPTMGPSRA